jgi:hypothetical protein
MIEGACHCGQVHWRYGPEPTGATACNCTVCRRWGALWIYGFHGEDVDVEGPTAAYVRGEAIEFHFCPRCACVVSWRAITPGADGRRWGAVNARLAEPEAVAALPMDHFDGLTGSRRQPRDGRCVADYWF